MTYSKVLKAHLYPDPSVPICAPCLRTIEAQHNSRPRSAVRHSYSGSGGRTASRGHSDARVSLYDLLAVSRFALQDEE